MSDLISKQRAIEAIDRFIPADPMMSDYTQGISVGLAIATRCIEEFSQENDDSSQGLVNDLISRQDAKDAIDMALDHIDHVPPWVYDKLLNVLNEVPSAEKAQLSGEDATKDATSDLISRQDAIDAVEFGITYAKAIDVNTGESKELFKEGNDALKKAVERLKELPSAEPERNTGEWITDAYGNIMCSECGWNAPRIMTGSLANRHLGYEKSEFCWHCGAYMRGEAE